MTNHPGEVALSIRVRGHEPLDLNQLLRMCANQRGATRARRAFQKDQRTIMRSQASLPREPLEGPFHVRFCRIHQKRKAVDIDNAAAGLKTILDGLAEERAILHDGHKQITEIERVWQHEVASASEVGFYLALVRPRLVDPRALLSDLVSAVESEEPEAALELCRQARAAGLLDEVGAR